MELFIPLGPTPAGVLVALMSLLACAPAPDPSASRAWVLQAERELLRASEKELIERQGREALAAGRLGEAAKRSRVLREIDPAAGERLAAQVRAHAVGAGPELALALAEALGAAPDALADLEVAVRLAPARREQTLASYQGVTLAMGERVLQSVGESYVEEVSEGAMAEGARRRLAVVGRVLGRPLSVEGASPLEVIRSATPSLGEELAVAEGVSGALWTLDPWTLAVWPSQIASWEAHHAGEEVGVGLEVALVGGQVVVTLPAPEGPAWRAGVRQGDVVRSVEGREVREVQAVTQALLGPPGSTVSLGLRRGERALEVSLTRAVRAPPTVFGWATGAQNQPELWLEEGLLFLRIERFRPHTDEELSEALLAVEGAAIRGVILDLRGNPGGDVQAAVNVVDTFVARGVIAQLAGRGAPILPPPVGGQVPWNEAVEGGVLEGKAVVVLIDAGTASAAEVVGGALQQLAGARLVGAGSHGKGVSQSLRVDEALGVAWQLTTQVWTLPDGHQLRPGRGLSPDVEVLLSPAEAFQVDVMRRRRQAPRRHLDGSEMVYVGTVRRADLPQLGWDPVVEAARGLLSPAELRP